MSHARSSRLDRTKAFGLDSFLLAYLFLSAAAITRYFRGVPLDGSPEQLALAATAGALLGLIWFCTGSSPACELAGQLGEEDPRWARKGRGALYFALVAVTLVAGLLVTKVSLSALADRDGLEGVARILAAFFHPQFSILGRALAAVVETIYIALIATLLAIPPAFGLSFLAARNITGGSAGGRLVYFAVRGGINFLRSVEPMIWAIIFSIWVGIGPFAGMMALMVNSIAGLVKLYSEQIENVDRGVITALESTGASPWQVVWFGVVPQILLPFLAFSIYRWDVNVRMATVIGLVGGGGIGTLLMQYQGLAKWNEVGLIILVISMVVWAMDFLSAKVRERVI